MGDPHAVPRHCFSVMGLLNLDKFTNAIRKWGNIICKVVGLGICPKDIGRTGDYICKK